MREHTYRVGVEWTGNLGSGTTGHRDFTRDHVITVPGVGTLLGSADPFFRGDATRFNPEQLLLASLSQCHLMTYLWLAVRAGVIVTAYEDNPVAVLREEPNGSGHISSVTLHPTVTLAAGSDPAMAEGLHDQVGEYCFIARSVNFPIHHEVTTRLSP